MDNCTMDNVFISTGKVNHYCQNVTNINAKVSFASEN